MAPSSSASGAWLAAVRPRTLPAAAAPVLVGCALAWSDGAFRAGPAVAALLGALLLQVGTNLANDYYDFVKGADRADRVGPARAAASGLLAPRRVRDASFAVFAAAVAVGFYLLWVGGWPVVAIGVAAVVCGLLYTGGPWPLGYHGLGDPLVFVFFGPVAVAGTYWVQALALPPIAVLAGVPIGLLATAILVVNNVRDAATDARAGKRTLAVRLGPRAGRAEYVLLVGGAYATVVGLAVARSDPWLLLPFAAAPLAARLSLAVLREEGPPLNARLAGTAAHLALFGALLALGVVL